MPLKEFEKRNFKDFTTIKVTRKDNLQLKNT